jgi:hypothetical protein
MLGKDLDQSAASPQDVRKVLAHAARIRQLVRISREQYGRQGTADQLSQSVARALTRRGDHAFMTSTLRARLRMKSAHPRRLRRSRGGVPARRAWSE